MAWRAVAWHACTVAGRRLFIPYQLPQPASLRVVVRCRLAGADRCIRRDRSGVRWTFPDRLPTLCRIDAGHSGRAGGLRLPEGRQLYGAAVLVRVCGGGGRRRPWELNCVPVHAASGDHCTSTLHAVNALANSPTTSAELLRIGYIGWVFLAVGLVLLLRAAGHGRRVGSRPRSSSSPASHRS